MADMFAIVDKDGRIISDVCDTEDDAWLSQPTDGDDCRCIPVTVTPNGSVDCRLCGYANTGRFSLRCESTIVCNNGDNYYHVSQPIQLYNVT